VRAPHAGLLLHARRMRVREHRSHHRLEGARLHRPLRARGRLVTRLALGFGFGLGSGSGLGLGLGPWLGLGGLKG